MPPKKSKKSKKSREKLTIPISTSSSGVPKWRQSPVDVNYSFVWSQKFSPLLLMGYNLSDGVATMANTGKTVTIQLSDRYLPCIYGGPLNNDRFMFDKVQFRWGQDNCKGAEHSINNMWYSMEAQILHWNTRYESIEECYKKPDGFAIMSYFLQAVGCPDAPANCGFARITDNLMNIRKMGTETQIPPDCLHWMLEACAFSGYYTYMGSLPTYPYQECAIWIIVPNPIRISKKQVEAFRSLYDYKWDHIQENTRAQQALHGRQIWYALDSLNM